MNIIRKYGILALMIIVSAFSVFFPIYIWPKEVSNDFNGVMFIDGNQSYSESVSIVINGYMNRRLLGGTRFTGKIKVEGWDMPSEYQEQNIQIKFTPKKIGVLIYLDESGEKTRFVEKGYISMPLDITSLVISLTESDDNDIHEIDGSTIIAGPAATRNEALIMANDTFGKVLEEPLK